MPRVGLGTENRVVPVATRSVHYISFGASFWLRNNTLTLLSSEKFLSTAAQLQPSYLK